MINNRLVDANDRLQTANSLSSTSSELGRKAALTSAGTAAGAGGAYAATGSGHSDNIEDPTHTDRSFTLSGGAVEPQSSTTSPSYTAGASVPASTSTSSTANPATTTGLNTGTAGGTNAVSGDAARANLGLDRFSALDHTGHSHSFRGDPCETEPAEKTLPFIPGPHATVAANMLDPHVPGEFPRDDGMDIHSTPVGETSSQLSEPYTAPSLPQQTHDHNPNREAAVIGGVGIVGAAETGDLATHKKSTPTHVQSSSPTATSPLGSNPTYPSPLGSHDAMADRTIPTQQPVSSSTTINPEDEHHHGRNAALVGGGATAAGLGAYAATRDHEKQPLGSSAANPTVQQSGTYQPIAQSSSPQHVPGNPLTGVPDAQPQATGLQNTQQPALGQEKEHHYGRNAALAGGATAATGAAGYAALDGGRGETGPASKTIGPHDSNLANIVDPRVRPEPEKMKDHTTSGPWQSDTLNKLDPKVESDPYKADVKAHGYATREPTMPVQLQQNQQQQVPLEQDKQHHYGRDAALVGGAGAAGYGASQLHDRREQDPLTQNQQQVPIEQNKEHHYGRDAALVGGAGAAGYGASQLHDRRHQDPLTQSQQQQQVPLEQDKEHHYGRDAALVGGTGAAAYGASQVYDKHEQESLAQKEQEKLMKEHEKQAKHDAKEHDKQVKHDAHEAEKARKKEEEKLAKEHDKQAKEHAKEQEKIDKHNAKEAEKAEEKRLKELEKMEKEKEKENHRLAAARADEAEAKHKEHNKLHKDPPEEREKKDGILHRIFHHKQYERERPEGRGASFDDERERPKGLEYKDADEERFARQHEQLEAKKSLDSPGHAGLPATAAGGVGGAGSDGIVTEPHTGLPMNVGKYGSGAGGTDGGEHIAGYGEHVAGYHAK